LKILKISGTYDGSQIEPLWAQKYGIYEDNIVVMIGGMNVGFKHMVDLEDLEQKKEIKGDEVIHFLIEHYDSNDLKLAYYRQRIFVCCAEETLKNFEIYAERSGDDLYINGGKLTVSVATVGKTQKIHFGVNITKKGVPKDVSASGLKDFLHPEEIEKFIDMLTEKYINEVNKIESDMKKTKIFL